MYISPGGYVSLIRTAVALKDISMLQPLSVKDAIWLDVEMARARKDDVKVESEKIEFLSKRLDGLYEMLLDVREVNRNTNSYVQLAALKGSKSIKIEPIKQEDLPSYIMEKERQELESRRKEKETPDKPKKKKYATYAEYLAAEESDEEAKAEQARLFRNAVALTEHVKKLETKQGGFESSKGAKQIESEEERLRKIREEREKSKKS